MIDPENRLLWQFNRRRLAAEEIRDAMLAVSGRINLKSGGSGVMVPVDPDLVSLLYKPSQWIPARDASEYDRRSIYLVAKRNLRLPFMETFDAPALLASCALREASTHAPRHSRCSTAAWRTTLPPHLPAGWSPRQARSQSKSSTVASTWHWAGRRHRKSAGSRWNSCAISPSRNLHLRFLI